MNTDDKQTIIAFPAEKKGNFAVWFGEHEEAPIIHEAHNGELSAITLNHEGTLVATASER